MLISLAIFAVITAFATANFNSGRQGDELRYSSQLVASAIRRAQSAASAGETVRFCRGGARDLLACPGGQDSACGGGTCVNEVPPGYGIRFPGPSDPRRMITFEDGNGNHRYDAGEEYAAAGVSPGAFVTVDALSPTDGGLDIVFDPPKPTAYFNGDTATAVATITLRHPQIGQTRSVTVNRVSGQVSAE